MSLKVGDKAPDFTLKNTDFENVSLSSLLGKKNIVLLFFPFVNSGMCEKELCTFGDGLSHYSDLNAQVVAVSVDSAFSQKLWVEKLKFPFPLLSDFNKEVCQAYGAMFDVFVPGKFDYKGVAKRSAFVIDKNGVIQYIEILESPGEEPNYENIQAALKKLQ
ncbi:MAG: redoxin domain-containing protein [Bacteroidetes bacterium]|nr:redoxin domain-containing protein [Bacteroidota bacterium]